MTISKQNKEQAPPERIWIDAETNVGRTRGEGTFYFTKPDFPSAAYVPEPPATAGAVAIPDAPTFPVSSDSSDYGCKEDDSVTKDYDGFRAGMLRAAEMARNEFKRAPEVKEMRDEWRKQAHNLHHVVKDYADAADQIITALESLPSTPVGKQRCVKCGHDGPLNDAGECQWVQVEGIVKRECHGCKCEFSVGKEAGEQRAREWLPPLPLPWIDANDHAWELRRGIDCVECPDCCFVFAAIHCNGDDSGYTCPNCHGNSRATPSPVDHEKQAREIVDDLIAADSHVYIPQSLYEPFVTRITTALQASAGVDPRPSLQSIYKAIEDALNSYRMHHTRELPDLDNGLSLVDRLSPDADKDVTRGREELDLLIDHVCGAVGDVFRSTDAVPSEAAQQAARALWDELYTYLTANDDLNPWRKEFYEADALEIISRYCGTGEMK